MESGSREAIRGMIKYLIKGKLSLQQLEIIGRNLWRRGLALQVQAHRVEREMREAEEARKLSLKKAERRKVDRTLVNRTRWKKTLAKREEQRARDQADQRTRLPL